MIISASRRTDIPACYADWFFERIRQQFVLVRNPFRFHQISKISLSASVVDGIVFWTKNPAPMLQNLALLSQYPYYFQFTLTPYGHDIEPNLPSKNTVIIPAFQALSEQIGKKRVIWRYDPVLFSSQYTMEYHIKYFHMLAKRLSPYTDTCIISFLDHYRNTEKAFKNAGILSPSQTQRLELIRHFSQSAHETGLSLCTCAESADYSAFGIEHARCIDADRFMSISGQPLVLSKDKNQRPACGCAESIDIGCYNTCENSCIYCYANHDHTKALRNAAQQTLKAPILGTPLTQDDSVSIRHVKSFADPQISLPF